MTSEQHPVDEWWRSMTREQREGWLKRMQEPQETRSFVEFDKWRSYLAGQRLEQTQIGRLARILLRLPCGVHPSKALAREIIRRRHYDWVLEAFPGRYTSVTGIPCDMKEFLPNEFEMAKLVPSTAPKKRIPREFIGVCTTLDGKWTAAIAIAGQKKYLGIFAEPHLAALEYDRAARANPLKSGRPRRLNFMIEDPLACTPEPRRFFLERAA